MKSRRGSTVDVGGRGRECRVIEGKQQRGRERDEREAGW